MSKSNNNLEKDSRKPRSKKMNPTIDLTAMVSVSFLLIAFFMITLELSKPKVIELGLPEKSCSVYTGTRCGLLKSNVITLLLDDNDRIVCYMGYLEYADELPKVLEYGKNGIRKELLSNNKMIKDLSSNFSNRNFGVTVIIKPSKKSNFKNLVDILDEMNITNIQSYTIINDYTPEEFKLLSTL